MMMKDDEPVIFGEERGEVDSFTCRYFIELNAEKYVVGMLIAFSQGEAENFTARSLTELDQETFESIGQDSQYIDGSVVQGAPMVPVLDTEAKRAILAARIRDAGDVIQILTDAEEMGMATDEEKSSLTAWKKYRVLLSRVDPETQPPEEWPQPPKT